MTGRDRTGYAVREMMVNGLSQLRTRTKVKLLLAYELHAETLRLDRVVGRFTPAPTPVNEEYEPASISGTAPGISFLVATTDAGLLLFEGSRARRLFRGRDFFGVTTWGGRWYAVHGFAVGHSCIISFRLEEGRAVDARVEVAGLMRGVHQIDFIDDSLWIVDTYHDRVLVVPGDAIGNGWRDSAIVHYPVGRSGVGREQPNHAHFNSILGWDGGIYLVAHHEGAKTGRDSELFLLDLDGTVRDRASLRAVDCHNVGLLDGELVVCRSKERTVSVGGQIVLRLDGYTRGLALGNDFQVVGTSTESASREERASGHGSAVVTDRDFTHLATIVLSGTQVNEIRRVDRPDLGLSSMQRFPAEPAA